MNADNQESAILDTELQLIFMQASVLEIWSKTEAKERIQMAQNMAVALAKANALATLGRYEGPHPSKGSRSLREAFRGWS